MLSRITRTEKLTAPTTSQVIKMGTQYGISCQLVGTGTFTIQYSNDSTNWINSTVVAAAAAGQEDAIHYLYARINLLSSTGQVSVIYNTKGA